MGNVALFFIGAYLYTWAIHGAMLFLKIPYGSPKGRIIYMVGLFGPFLSAALISLSSSGPEGLVPFLCQISQGVILSGWYLVAIFLTGAIYLAGILAHHAVTKTKPGPLFRKPRYSIPILLFTQLLVVIAEEYGWRGYALPALQTEWGAVAAALVISLFWTFWHLPMVFVPGSNQYRTNIAQYFFFIATWSLIMTALYNAAGGSLLICMVFHAAANIWGHTMNTPESKAYTLTVFGLNALFAVGALLLLLRVF